MLTRAERIGQSLKYFPCKNEYLSLMPRSHVKKKPDVVMQPTVQGEFQASEKTSSKTKLKQSGLGD